MVVWLIIFWKCLYWFICFAYTSFIFMTSLPTLSVVDKSVKTSREAELIYLFFFHWCISEGALGQSCSLSTTYPNRGAGRQAEAAGSPSWKPWSHRCCWCCCSASNEMLCQAVEKAFAYLLHHSDGRRGEIMFKGRPLNVLRRLFFWFPVHQG